YHFAPTSVSTASLVNNWTENFAAVLDTHTVSGTIMVGTSPISGVTVAVSGSSNTATVTDSNGQYSLELNALGDYTLTPSRENYTFAPPLLATTTLSGNWAGNDFAAILSTYAASGTILVGTAPLAGATVTVYDSVLITSMTHVALSTTTDALGKYSFVLNGDADYSIAPTKDYYTFSPEYVSTSTLSGDWLNNDFAAALATYTVIGTIAVGTTPVSGVTVSVSGSSITSTVTDSNGQYSFTFDALGGYSLAPSKEGYHFTPPSVATASLVGNWTENFAAAFDTHTVSGTILVGIAPLAGVTVAVSGDATSQTVTDSSGAYVFTGLEALGSYTLTPYKTGYHFTPPSVATTSLLADWTENFAALIDTYTVSGTIAVGTTPVSGVTVSVSGSSVTSTVTDSSGAYAFIGLEALGAYTLTPAKAQYTFNPGSLSTASLVGAWTADFAAISGYPVSGQITLGTAPLQGITVAVTGGTSTSTVTDASGNYSFNLPPSAAYTLTPVTTGYSFLPVNYSTTALSAPWTGNDFAAKTAYTLSGKLTWNGAPLPDAAITLTGTTMLAGMASAYSSSTVTDSNGDYSFIVNHGNYVLSPSKAGYYFNPSQFAVSAVSNDVLNIDFASANTGGTGNFVEGSENGYVEPRKGPAKFRLTPTESGHLTIRIYTLKKARLVRTLEADVTAGTLNTVNWDCLNTDNETVGSGVYVAVLSGAGYDNEKMKVGVLK
ncbi:MAG: carboxypeptidase regulatory-like domain-containing protein, partial [Elusimicrobiaceae bacterium]